MTQAAAGNGRVSIVTIEQRATSEGESLDPEVQAALRREGLIDHLLEMLADEDQQLKRTGAVTLGWLKEPRAVQPLIELLAQPGMQEHVSHALVSIGFRDEAAYRAWLEDASGTPDPLFFAITDMARGAPGGVASLMRIAPDAGTIEVGHICLAPALQRTRAASEAIFLFADWVFREGYRRFEWKCDSLNRASRRAAERFGFSFEGVFRQHTIVKGRNRDTAWFAMTDGDWKRLKPAWKAWLAPGNFDEAGRQRRRLGELTAPHRVASDPG